jgi:hypothetical protein
VIRLLKTRFGTDERGASLVLALAFLGLFGLAIGALLSYTDTNIRTTVALRTKRSGFYAADGAVQAAINGVRSNTALGVSGTTTCPPAVTINGLVPTVTCAGLAGGGSAATGGNNGINTPSNGILTLGTSLTATDGALFSSNDNMSIRGSIYSDSTITDANGELDVAGNATAQAQSGGASGCVGAANVKTVTGTLNCYGASLLPDPGVTDTTYALPISSVPAAGAIPACTAGIATFNPGTFSDPAALSACAKNFFKPGTYYFNFPTSNPTWNVNYVIGGTLISNNTTCDQTKPGVLFIFGGRSNVVVGDGATFIVCASPSNTSQQIALYGLGHPVTVAPTMLVNATGFVNPNYGMVLGGPPASAALSTGSPTFPTATETVKAFTPAIPAGSTINKVVLRIRHFESGSSPNNLKPEVVVTTPTGTVLDANPGVCSFPCADWVSSDLSASLNTPGMISGVTVAYSATLNGANKLATENLGGIVLDVEYTPAGFQGETEAVCAATTCSLISGTSSGATISVSGTVYAPLASVNVTASNTSVYAFNSGVILRSLSIQFTNSVPQGSTSVSIPPITVIYSPIRKVLFTATVAANGVTTTLTSQVWFDDTVSPGATVTVKSWSVDR